MIPLLTKYCRVLRGLPSLKKSCLLSAKTCMTVSSTSKRWRCLTSRRRPGWAQGGCCREEITTLMLLWWLMCPGTSLSIKVSCNSCPSNSFCLVIHIGVLKQWYLLLVGCSILDNKSYIIRHWPLETITSSYAYY